MRIENGSMAIKWAPRPYNKSICDDLVALIGDWKYGKVKAKSPKHISKEEFNRMSGIIPHHTDEHGSPVKADDEAPCPYCGNDVLLVPPKGLTMLCRSCGRNDFTVITNSSGKRVLITKQKG